MTQHPGGLRQWCGDQEQRAPASLDRQAVIGVQLAIGLQQACQSGTAEDGQRAGIVVGIHGDLGEPERARVDVVVADVQFIVKPPQAVRALHGLRLLQRMHLDLGRHDSGHDASGQGQQQRQRRAAHHLDALAVKSFFGSMACAPTLPSTSWVISMSTATLASM